MESIELIRKVGDMYPGSIFIINKTQYYNEDGSFTIERNKQKITFKKSLFKPYKFKR